jgi:hypothetical protein
VFWRQQRVFTIIKLKKKIQLFIEIIFWFNKLNLLDTKSQLFTESTFLAAHFTAPWIPSRHHLSPPTTQVHPSSRIFCARELVY